jgi:hypothetical protein
MVLSKLISMSSLVHLYILFLFHNLAKLSAFHSTSYDSLIQMMSDLSSAIDMLLKYHQS